MSWFWNRRQGSKSKDDNDSTAGLSNPNLFLDEGTTGFTHLKDVGADKGIFAVGEVREDTRQADRGGSRIIALPRDRYQKPPQVSELLTRI